MYTFPIRQKIPAAYKTYFKKCTRLTRLSTSYQQRVLAVLGHHTVDIGLAGRRVEHKGVSWIVDHSSRSWENSGPWLAIVSSTCETKTCVPSNGPDATWYKPHHSGILTIPVVDGNWKRGPCQEILRYCMACELEQVHFFIQHWGNTLFYNSTTDPISFHSMCAPDTD